ncbi:Terminase small subunit superfamily [Methylophaga thiooxydans DMS010]|uniref:Terminase small subunit superfamily n=1 Tax=Methylophaga thiooxydans DMS010 TaxID=637616 RepID=C0N6G0_9GAMM|nr:Terminase small subunit superfamily [Methylophaga thiooxydans DMS010]
MDEYLVDFNATQAAVRAGYSQKTASPQAARLLANVNVSKAISERVKSRSEKLAVDSEYVLRRLIEIDQMDVVDILNHEGQLKPVSEWPEIWRQTITSLDVAELSSEGENIGLLKKVKWPDKVKNLELLGKHTDIGAWEKRVEVNLNDRKSLAELLEEAARES